MNIDTTGFRRPQELGDQAFPMGRLPPLKEELDEFPAAITNEIADLFSILSASSAVLIPKLKF
jgi:hypothetical protein